MKDAKFPPDFLWGCSTASFQIEGASGEDGRGQSIWDEFCTKPGKIFDGSDGTVACDSYHRMNDDIGLLKSLNVNAYRFSIAWPRIQPDGRGSPNAKGIDYYSKLVDALLEADIEPWVTLYHWDLPLALEKEGGWPKRETAFRFAEYADIVFSHLGTRVKHWASMNEPWCSAFLGYRGGEHAPGAHDSKAAIRAVHHLLLGHGLSAKAFKEGGYEGEFGIIINPAAPRPATGTLGDIEAAHRASLERTALWLDPVFGRGYPEEYAAAMHAEFPVETGDMDIIAAPVDFVGVNYYNEDAVTAASFDKTHPLGYSMVPTWQDKTEMGWDIVPQGLRRILGLIAREWSPKALYVTENGAAFADIADSSGRIHDSGRIAYYRSHLEACRDAIGDGVPLKGYFAWTLLDNFEWSWGYSRKFGLVAIEPDTLARIPKDSFFYYRDLIAGFGF
ncbi:MAG: GH1 family beta-glucosidase [Rectinemataceae bacterium]|nr:GH1 family beta-glucosidase [Rectinemataceae bacterium]